MRRASLVAQVRKVQLGHLELKVYQDTLAVVDLLVYLAIQDPKELQDSRVLRVPSAPLAQQVNYFVFHRRYSIGQIGSIDCLPLTLEMQKAAYCILELRA